ncbi:post-GPI attachment to proteins factor 6 isoform X1 [Gadus chalcogrammus]|uniref:post-GPI attachment to proteins factor 6 isoform X1 n=1 Tax=Gadus chalcogrammus TaxID=1042646 RepID=UPI0024C4C613|nr:post-GPI attachment to proteins factor 6 isoform X1 [Gadus chalcogrammus]
MEFHIILCFLFVALTAVSSEDDGQVVFVKELSSKPAQKLSRYGWFGSARLQRFVIPEDAAVARWRFTVTKGHRFPGFCGEHNVTIHIRWGAPPVVNPVGQMFPNDTAWSLAHSLHLPVTSQATATFNLSDPSPGDWYVAAHLPRDDGRIEQKGFPSCSYYFQPQLSIRRAVDTPILQPTSGLPQAAAPDRPARLKLFVPEFVSSLSVSLTDCHSQTDPGEGACPLVLRLGSASALKEGLVTVNCSTNGCSVTLLAPPWHTWLRVVVESKRENHTVTFNVSSNYTVSCKPQSVGLSPDIIATHGNNSDRNATLAGNRTAAAEVDPPGELSVAGALSPGCVWDVPVLAEELDVLSVRFSPASGPNVSVARSNPTLLSYPLHTLTSGGTLSLQLTLNTTSTSLGNSSSVAACLSPWAPVLGLSGSQPCQTALFPGYRLHVNSSSPKAVIRLPFPQAATWYLSLQLTCNSSGCGNVSVVSVVPEVSVSACVEDCGTYGECRLLRSNTYLYAACVCKAGWSGWGCTDGSAALSYGRQVTATLLLTLSNLLFLPAIVVAARRCYVTEASVYLFTLFFSTFYHACDQPGVAVMCIMDYDTLQFCDFLGSVCSIWVTLLCMARVRDTLKYTLFVLGALLIAMSMQLDRRGLWNMLGPVLCAVLALVIAWVYRGVRRRHCYPPSWRRWLLYLVPGLLCALVGVCVYIFAETEDNYLYTHSVWHVLVALSVVFLLPPRERSREAWGWSRGWAGSWSPRVCGYTLCHGSKEELYTVS